MMKDKKDRVAADSVIAVVALLLGLCGAIAVVMGIDTLQWLANVLQRW